jgi:FAD/FMN-containing dehydrogenase
MFANSMEEARSTLAMLDGSPLIDRCLSKSVAQPTNFEALSDASGALWPPDLRCKVDALFYNSPLVEVIRAMKDHVLTTPSPKTVFMLAIFTGARGAPATPADAAFSMTGKLYGGAWTMWDDAADDAANMAWHDESMRLLKPYVAGHYVAETDTVGHPEYARLSFAPASWQRLADLRQTYDPDGLFFNFTEGFD